MRIMCTEQIDFSLNILGFGPPLFTYVIILAMILIRISIVCFKRKLLMCAPLTSKKTVAVSLEVWAKPLSYACR